MLKKTAIKRYSSENVGFKATNDKCECLKVIQGVPTNFPGFQSRITRKFWKSCEIFEVSIGK